MARMRFTATPRRRVVRLEHIGSASRPKGALMSEALERRVLLSGYVFNQLGSFAAATGTAPTGAVVLDGAGNLYGATRTAGGYGFGTVFEIAKGSTTIKSIASFPSYAGAETQVGAADSYGDLFGTESDGGANGKGSVFEVHAGSGVETTLASFDFTNGQLPVSLVMNPQGNLYGATISGGTFGNGVLFELAKGSGTITDLASFQGAGQSSADGNLVLDSSGNLYGTTQGDSTHAGTAFELTNGSGTITTLASFALSQGPEGLAMDANGNLFGSTFAGGDSNKGTAFEIVKGSGVVTTLASFGGALGNNPRGAVALDAAGNLYGATDNGGPSGDGTVFEIAGGSNAITTLAAFNGVSGNEPFGGVTLDSAGNIYGSTLSGGGNNEGAAFEVSPLRPSQLAFVQQPQSVTAGVAMALPITVQVEDQSGNLVTSDGSTVTITSIGSGPMFGTASAIAMNGVATFSGLSFNTAGPHMLRAADASLTGATSASFDVSPATPSKLVFGLQPTAAVSNGAIRLTATVNVEDTFGNIIASDNSNVTLAISSGPGMLGGMTTVAAINGVATFSNLSLPADATYTLTATDGNLNVATSDPFGVTPTAYVLKHVGYFGTNDTGAFPAGGLAVDASGDLFGAASQGGAFGKGTIYEIAHRSAAATALASFNGDDGATPQGGLVLDAAGDLYGVTTAGGAFGAGTIFEIIKGSGAITVLASFPHSNVTSPVRGDLAVDAAGDVFGAVASAGATGSGTIFEVVAGSGAITTLASFNGTNGSYPDTGVVMDAEGNLYGAAGEGGAFQDGAVFELASGSSTITTLASFNGTDGSFPLGKLALDSSGNLYGTTSDGGTANIGTAFEIVKGSGMITTLASFSAADGRHPQGDVALDANGNLYGIATQGGAMGVGTAFEIVKGSGAITTLAALTGGNGTGPVDGAVLDADGNLYGATSSGPGAGKVYEIAQGSGMANTLASFGYPDGTVPQGLVVDSSGNLYGSASKGGSSNLGTVLGVADGSAGATTLDSFNGSNGSHPIGGLAIDSSGNLYGTTNLGGAFGDGTVFEVAAGSGTITTLATFNGKNGSGPDDGVTIDAAGNLFGTTAGGGAYGLGSVFKVARGSGVATTLASFTSSARGNVTGPLVVDSGGNLYGTFAAGVTASDAGIFEVVNGSGTVNILTSLDSAIGSPPSNLTIDPDGNLYGPARVASGVWNIFEVPRGTSAPQILAATANQPASLLVDPGGNLFGLTSNGGSANTGTIFTITAGSGRITTLASLGLNDGMVSSGLAMDRAGDIYATTAAGIIELVPVPPAPAPNLVATTINDGSAQRSQVRGIALKFSTPVVLDPGAITLDPHPGQTGTIPTLAWSTSDGGLTYIVTFRGNGVVAGSVADGVYDLTIHAALVHAGPQTLAADHILTFHRLFGDIDGNGTVNSADYFQFKKAFGSATGSALYDPNLDFDGNGIINSSDYFRFKANFGRRFVYRSV